MVSYWRSQFRKMYGRLGTIRAFILKSVSMVAMSATLSKRIRDDVLSKVQFKQMTSGYITVDVGNDQQNVSRIIQHPMDSYADLDFVILKDVKQASDIPLTRIYADSIPVSISIEDHLTELLPQSMHGLGILRPYNATYLTEYREEVMRLARLNTIQVLICTDAAGMIRMNTAIPIRKLEVTVYRDATYQISSVSCSGNSRRQCQYSSNEQDEQDVVLERPG